MSKATVSFIPGNNQVAHDLKSHGLTVLVPPLMTTITGLPALKRCSQEQLTTFSANLQKVVNSKFPHRRLWTLKTLTTNYITLEVSPSYVLRFFDKDAKLDYLAIKNSIVTDIEAEIKLLNA